MTRYGLGAAALLMTTASWASAGALDRTAQPITLLFEEGSYAELSFGFTSPTVEGTFTSPLGTTESGDVGESFVTPIFGLKRDIDDRISYAVILEQPFGADVSYADADPSYPIAESEATFESRSLTVVGRYEFDNGFSLHGGARFVEVDAELFVRSFEPGLGFFTSYDAAFETDYDLGYLVGAAYERPEIALRVALTYSSETSFSHETDYTLGVEPGGVPTVIGGGTDVTEYTLPQSVNLDFQTGIAPGTLLFGSVRWADWSETEINVPAYPANPVVSYEDDYITYTVGVGRQLTDQLSGAVSVIYEPGVASDFDLADPLGSGGSNLSPTDGQLALLLAGSYQVTKSLEVGGGVRFARLGDVSTRLIGAEFEDNEAVSVGVRVGYRF